MRLGVNLELETCPHCGVNRPHLSRTHKARTDPPNGGRERYWAFYVCSGCAGIVTAWSYANEGDLVEMYPAQPEVDSVVPTPARDYLQQAIASRHAPAGSVMLCASSVDAMLKVKGLVNGSLYTRIQQAATNNLITAEMAEWAHDVRLDANDQRHADVAASLPTIDDAERCIEFVRALAQFLFVLPDRVRRGRLASGGGTTP
jgi:hypothetical protein